MPENILGISRTENIQQLAEIYSASDVFLNPTYEDNFPATNIEALACGTPVITYKTGGSPDAIDENTGIVVEKGDIDGLIAAINQVKEKGKAFYSACCVYRAKKWYNKEDRYKEYLEIYNEVLTKSV